MRTPLFVTIMIKLLFFAAFSGNAQTNPNVIDCISVKLAFKVGITKYHNYLKMDTIFLNNSINLQNSCIEKEGFKFSVIDFSYLDKDTSIFIKPKLVIGLNYHDNKLKFLRMGLHKVRFVHETGNWETVLQGNIEIYFERRKNLRRIRKIVRNL